MTDAARQTRPARSAKRRRADTNPRTSSSEHNRTRKAKRKANRKASRKRVGKKKRTKEKKKPKEREKTKENKEAKKTEIEKVFLYNDYCEKEIASIATTLLKKEWKREYDHLYENPGISLPLSPLSSDPIKLKRGGGKKEEHNNLIHLYRHIANLDVKTKKIKMRETVVSRFMFVLRLSTLYNLRAPTDKHQFTESQLTEYTNCLIRFITHNTSFDVFQALKIPLREKNAKIDLTDILTTLDTKISNPEIIERMKLYVGPSTNIKSNDLTSTPILSFGLVGVLYDLSPSANDFQTITHKYNTDCDVQSIESFLGSQPSNQKSQCVLLSVILYVLSKIADLDYSPNEIIKNHEEEYKKHFEIYNEGIFNRYFEEVYSSENLVELIKQRDIEIEQEPENEMDALNYVHSTHKTLRDILRSVCDYKGEEVIPYNTLISFNIEDDEYVHKSFVNTIHPSVRELIFGLFTDLRLDTPGITLPFKLDKDVVLAPNIVTYDRTEMSRSKLSFLQTDNIAKKGDSGIVEATYTPVEHEITDDNIKDYNIEESPDCTLVSTMSYLVYLPTYHVATYKFEGLSYFGAYDPDPDCIKLLAVPSLKINKRSLRKLNDDKRMKKNYLFSYHRIHVWLDAKEKRIYLAIRGTHSSRDWQHSDYLVARGEGHYMDRVDIIDDVLRQVYSDMVAVWELGQSSRSKYKLIITGHSLGGHLTNITKVLTYKNKLYGFTDTFTNGFPISCQPYYSTNDHSDRHFQILNWAFSKDKGIVLNVEKDGAAELLVTAMTAGKISNNLIIFQVTRNPTQKPASYTDNYYTRLLFMAYTHAPYNFFGKKIWEKIMEHHTGTKLLVNGTVVAIDNACINPTKIKYADQESNSNKTIKIETSEFILTTNLACVQNCP
jgi:hypothetical protein